MSPRIIQIPLSGRDRRHYARELKRGEQEHKRLVGAVKAAYKSAHFLACEEWSARQFIGGPAEPSPTIAQALDAGCDLLEVSCRHCAHSRKIDLVEVIWPRDNQIHTLAKALRCTECRTKSRPNLVRLDPRRPPDDNLPTAAALRRKTRNP